MRASPLHLLSSIHNKSVTIQVPEVTKPHIFSKIEHANWRVRVRYSYVFYSCVSIVCGLLMVQTLLQYINPGNQVPTVKMSDLTIAIESHNLNPIVETVLSAILNDWMDLQYGIETDYTTGQTVIPMECTIEDVKEAMEDKTVDNKFRDIFVKIWETYNSGDLTPQSKWTPTSGWDLNLKPVLVFVIPDKVHFDYYPERYTF